MTCFGRRRDIGRRQNESGRHIVPLHRREHIAQIVPRFRRTAETELRQNIRAVKQHREALTHRQAIGAAVVLILRHGVLLKASSHLVKVAKLRNVREQVPCGKVHRELSSEEECDVRTFSGESSLNYTAGNKLDGYRYPRLRNEALLRELLDYLRLIASERRPDLNGLLAAHVRESGVVLEERADECVKAEFNGLSKLLLTACEVCSLRGELDVVHFERLVAVFPHPS